MRHVGLDDCLITLAWAASLALTVIIALRRDPASIQTQFVAYGHLAQSNKTQKENNSRNDSVPEQMLKVL